MMPALLRVEIVRHADSPEPKDHNPLAGACCSAPLPPTNGTFVTKPLAKSISGTEPPANGDLLTWEWGAAGMGVRQLPAPVGWVAVLPAQSAGWMRSFTGIGASGDDVPQESKQASFFGQQGGWMATKEQLDLLHNVFCPMGFLPPRDPEALAKWFPVGTVEFYSGGYQLFGSKTCRMARVVSIRSPKKFSNHLLMHATGNKQLQKVTRQVKTEIATLIKLKARAQGQTQP